MSLLVLWKHITNLFELPEDIASYVLFHFYMPLVKAERESVRIEVVFKYVKDGASRRRAISSMMNDLLADPTIELDMRILDGRIEKYVEMLEDMLYHQYIHVDDAVRSVLHKGLIMGDLTAFNTLLKNNLIDEFGELSVCIARIMERMMTRESWSDVRDEIISFAKYLLEKEMDIIMCELFILSKKNGFRLFVADFTTKEQGKIKTLGIELSNKEIYRRYEYDYH
jgi:hypothetical protein